MHNIYYTHINGVHKQVGITERKSKLQISSGRKYTYIQSEEFENSIQRKLSLINCQSEQNKKVNHLVQRFNVLYVYDLSQLGKNARIMT